MKKTKINSDYVLQVRFETKEYEILVREQAKRRLARKRSVSVASLVREAVDIASEAWGVKKN